MNLSGTCSSLSSKSTWISKHKLSSFLNLCNIYLSHLILAGPFLTVFHSHYSTKLLEYKWDLSLFILFQYLTYSASLNTVSNSFCTTGTFPSVALCHSFTSTLRLQGTLKLFAHLFGLYLLYLSHPSEFNTFSHPHIVLLSHLPHFSL